MSLIKRFAGTTAAFATVGLVAGGAAVAQQATPAPAQTQQAQPTIEPVTDAEVSKFVAANDEVSAIAAEVVPQLKAAEDDATAKELQASAQKQMVSAIQEEGLTPQRFTQIAQMAQMDPDLAAKLRAEMNG